jgi:hypothetical protein
VGQRTSPKLVLNETLGEAGEADICLEELDPIIEKLAKNGSDELSERL